MTIGVSMFAGDGGKSGISEYMRQVLRGMLAQSDENFVLFLAHCDRPIFDPKNSRVKIISYPNLWANPLFSVIWHLLWLPIALKLHRCDSVFMPAANRRLGYYYGVPSIGTVHDFSQLHVPAKYDLLRTFYVMRVLPNLMRRLDRVISISQSTSRDLIGFAGVSEKRIQLIYNGAQLVAADINSDSDCQNTLNHYGLKEYQYLLYVARIEHPGKNHARLIQAFKALTSNANTELKLVLAGSRWSGAEVVESKVAELELEHRVIFTGFVPESDLSCLYRKASVFVFPSLFEGFGIPLLEAMAAGVPVCSSNRASMPEVVGSAGLLFDPEDSAQIEHAINDLMSSDFLRDRYIRSGKKQAAKFSWKECAAQTLRTIITTQKRGYPSCNNGD